MIFSMVSMRFLPFSKFYYLFFYPFLFLTQVISFQYFAQIKCNFLSVKSHSFMQSFTVSEIVINLPY